MIGVFTPIIKIAIAVLYYSFTGACVNWWNLRGTAESVPATTFRHRVVGGTLAFVLGTQSCALRKQSVAGRTADFCPRCGCAVL